MLFETVIDTYRDILKGSFLLRAKSNILFWITIASVQQYLPGEATLFLLDYELDVTIAEIWKDLALAK